MEDMGTLKGREAERRWLLTYGLMHADRDKHLLSARRLGLSVTEISRLSGLSRQHVSTIVNSPGRDCDTAAGADHSSETGG